MKSLRDEIRRGRMKSCFAGFYDAGLYTSIQVYKYTTAFVLSLPPGGRGTALAVEGACGRYVRAKIA